MTELGSIEFTIQTPGESAPVLIPGIELHAESLNQRAISHRKTEIVSKWVAGSFVTQSVREEVIEQVSFYVDGRNDYGFWPDKSPQYRLQKRLDQLESALCQLSYAMELRIGDLVYHWDCSVAGYTIQTDQPLLAATMALVKAQIPRSPNATWSEA